MKGIDISSYQGNNINFNSVKADGIEAVIVKATESTTYTNMYFDSHTQGVINAGLKLGFYHFFRGNGIAEADYFCNTIAPYKDKMTIKPVIDVEVLVADINNQVLAFINRVKERLGVDCAIYSGAYFAGDYLTDNRLTQYAFWIAHYGVASNQVAKRGIWSNIDIAGHQYSSEGSVSGISGNVDMNVLYDSMVISSRPSTYEIFKNGTEVKIKRGAYWGLGKGNPTSGPIDDGWLNSLNNSRLIITNRAINHGSDEYYIGIYDQPIKTLIGACWIPVNQVSEVIHYVVQTGDTVWGIAQRFGTTVDAIVKQNVIGDGSLIKPGMILRVK